MTFAPPLGPYPPSPNTPLPEGERRRASDRMEDEMQKQRIAEEMIREARKQWENEHRKQKQIETVSGATKEHAEKASEDPWKHRSVGMQCRSCMWFVEKVGKLAGLGRCRRHAPTMGGYPAVFVHDWCGDHKLDENKV